MNDGARGGLIIAAPASGSGKTVLTLGLLRHLGRNGVAVASAKAGPDYIDPAVHAAATGRPCVNLDSWAMRPATLAAAARGLAADADLVICEGVMGLFDGATLEDGSTADLAALTGWPVVLVIDVAAQGSSAAAVLRGFADHRADVHVAGVIFNRVGGDRHAAMVTEAAAAAAPGIARLGCLPRVDDLALPDRHLGLVQAVEHPALEDFIERAADLVGGSVDVAALVALARPWTAAAGETEPPKSPVPPLPPLPPLGQRIALARDAAFAFAYPLVLDGWRAAGAEVMPFSPLADAAPAEDADAVYLPGGYPELHGGRLASNRVFLDGLRSAAGRGAVVLGECGGYMVLGRGLVDGDGARHAMADLLPLESSFARPRLHLGYRRVATAAEGPLGPEGVEFRGHEFHYAEAADEGPGDPLFRCTDARGTDLGAAGLVQGTVMGSFVHLIDRGRD